MTDPTQEFRKTLQAAGLTPPDTLIPGKLHRFPSNGKRSDTAGWCKLFPDGLGGTYGDFRSGLSETWQSRANERMTKEERDAFRRQMEQARRERDAEEEKLHLEAMPGFLRLWNQSRQDVDLTHAYLAVKGGIRPFGIRQLGQALIVPVWGADKALTGLQFIQPDGQKRFITGTRKAGSWCVLKPEGIPPTDWSIILVAEGWATAASLHTATRLPVFIAFDCGNLSAVARYIRQQFPAARLLFCADDDVHGKGQHHAHQAARQNNGMAIIPQWGGIDMSHERLTDFNDLHRAVGLDAVRHQIGNALENFTTEPSRPANDALETDEGEEIEAHRNAPRGTPTMLYGIFGEIGRTAADGTEANPYAACMNAMVFFSACVGREVYLSIGDEFHHARLFALHIGRSSVGRKGTALALLWRIIDAIDKQERNSKGGVIFEDSRLLPKWHIGGLSSREGVVMALHNGFTLGKDEHPPIHDKRYWAIESEFANTLAQAARGGNTLSSALRDLWDGKTLKPLTKQPIGASDPHLCMSAACTPSEFLDMLTARDRDNGFINRFLIFHAERTRLESRPRPTPDDMVAKFASRLLEIIAFSKGGYCWDSDPDLSSQNRRRIKMSSEADTLYDRLYYTELNSKKDGERIAGLMHRGGPYLLRMAMLFALSDLSEVIEVHHLEAAMAWVRYWRESVKFIFNDAQEEVEQVKTSDKAERLYQWLKARSKPATRTEIMCDCFTRHASKGDVDKAIDALLRDTPPRIEVITGEKAANGKAPKSYKARELGELGEVACAATVYPSSHGCELGEVGLRTWNSGPSEVNPSSPTSHGCELGESLALQSSSPDSPSSQTVNEKDHCELGFSDDPEEEDV
jgi:phage/plasmid primase-like uncharacterized protein